VDAPSDDESSSSSSHTTASPTLPLPPEHPAPTIRRDSHKAAIPRATHRRSLLVPQHGSAPDDDIEKASPTTCEEGDGPPEIPVPYWRAARESVVTYWALIVGNILEWYEFSTYGYLVPEIKANFFQGSSTLAWVGFGLTFAMRPFGGVALGWVGDRCGRRVGTTLSLGGMILATVVQGCLPCATLNGGSDALQTTGVVLLIVCRMLQGLSAGGEVGGISVTLGEHRPQCCLGFTSSLITAGASFSFFLSSGLVWLLRQTLTSDQMLLWGWRIPFLLPLIPGCLALGLRLRMPETAAFLATQKGPRPPPGRHFLKTAHKLGADHWASLVVCVCGTAGKAVATYMGPIYTCDFVSKYLGVPHTTSVGLACLAQLLTVVLCPFMGALCDTIGVGRMMLIGSVYVTISGVSLYAALVGSAAAPADQLALVAAAAVVVFGLGDAIISSAIFLWAPELYETSVRATGVGLSYNLAMTIFGGFGPVTADLLSASGFLMAPGILISAAGLLGTVSIAVSRILAARGRLTLTHIRPHPY